VFAHIPLWSAYPEWGWGTDDSTQALSYLKRFGSVSVLNGPHPSRMQKVEGHVMFHTAMSTAFPQPAPGTAPSPGPVKVPDDRLRKMLGLSRISFHDVNHPIAITDVPLEPRWRAGRNTGVRWTTSASRPATSRALARRSRGRIATTFPHTVVSTEKKFKSPVLDTGEQFAHRLRTHRGTYKYFCSISSTDGTGCQDL
jgi:hypothetical protein